MNIKEWIIKKLENDVENKAGHIDLEQLNEEERNKYLIQFGEGDDNLTGFLKAAYNHGAPSLFCCSGHNVQSAYVVLKVTDENIDLLRKLGKVLSNYYVATNFTDHHMTGRYVSYRSKYISTDWLKIATDVIENPELFEENNPEIYYHEEIYPSNKPFGFDLKKKILSYLRQDTKKLPIR